MTGRASSILVLAILPGCGWWISDHELAARVDADLDGVPSTRDCDDSDPTVSQVDTWYADADGDGIGGSDAQQACGAPDGYAPVSGDCDDQDAASTHLGTAWADGDGDGYGTGDAVEECGLPAGFAAVSGDCDDSRPEAHPGAAEVCNGLDDDCNGLADDGNPAPVEWYADGDSDGYGDDATAVLVCSPPPDTVAQGGDCNDHDAGIHPGAQEVCSGVDDDCDGLVDAHDPDESGIATWYPDADQDGWGGDATSVVQCSFPGGSPWVLAPGDCDDGEPAVNPGRAEICDGLDNDCDTLPDDDDPDIVAPFWHPDADNDGFGDPGEVVAACNQPLSYVADATDCDDGDGAIFPQAFEVHPATTSECTDTLDNDCDGLIDTADDDCHDDDADASYNAIDPLIAYDSDGDGTRESMCVVAALAIESPWSDDDAYRVFASGDLLNPTDTLQPADRDTLGAILAGAWCWNLTGVAAGSYQYKYESAASAADAAQQVDRFDCNDWKEASLDGYCGAFGGDPFCGGSVPLHKCDPALVGAPDVIAVDWNGASL